MAYKLSGGFHHRCSVPAPALFCLEALFRVKTDYVCDELMIYLSYTQGLPPRGSVVKNLPANARRCGFHSWVGKIPWRWKWQPTLVFLPGEPHEQRSLAGYSPWGHKALDTTEWLSMHTHILKIFDLSARVSCPYLTVPTHMLSLSHTHIHTHTHRLNEIPIYTMNKRKKLLRSLLILIGCACLFTAMHDKGHRL